MSEFSIKEFWERVEFLRKQKGLTQKEFGEKIGLAFSSYQQKIYYNVCPKIDQAFDMADILGVSGEFLITGKDEKISEQKNKELKNIVNEIAHTVDSTAQHSVDKRNVPLETENKTFEKVVKEVSDIAFSE